jgi:hypothetical protein
MEVTCQDVAFGVMTYKHRWFKQQKISMFGKEWNITIAAKAYSAKPITVEEQQSYKRFENEEKQIVKIMSDAIKAYINNNIADLANTWAGNRKIFSINDLSQIITPKTILFQQDGTAILLLDCPWDKEHGLAVKFYPKIEVGSQDLFL